MRRGIDHYVPSEDVINPLPCSWSLMSFTILFQVFVFAITMIGYMLLITET